MQKMCHLRDTCKLYWVIDFSQKLRNSFGSELGFGDVIKIVSYAIEKYPLSPTQDVLLSLHLKNWKGIAYLSSVAQ